MVGLDDYQLGWLARFPQFHDFPAERLRIRRIDFPTANPVGPAAGRGAPNVETAPFRAFGDGASLGTEIAKSPRPTSAIYRMDPDGGNLEIFAWGIRNPFGLAANKKGELFASDTGYEPRGSRPVESTPDSIWKIKHHAWYGFPDFAAGKALADPVLASHPKISLPLATLPAGTSPAQLDFNRGEAFGFAGELFVAELGEIEKFTGLEQTHSGFQVDRMDGKAGKLIPFLKNKKDAIRAADQSYISTPGLRRPISVHFSRDGRTLYIVDFGAFGEIPADFPAPSVRKETGVIWRVRRINQGTPAPVSPPISIPVWPWPEAPKTN